MPETITVEEGEIRVGGSVVRCGTSPYRCEVSVIDIDVGDQRKELVACWAPGPTSPPDCALFRYTAGGLDEVRPPLSPAAGFSTTGDGLVTVVQQTPYPRTERYALVDGALVQPALLQPVDLDGDGRGDAITWEAGVLRVGEAEVDCGSESFTCDWGLIDIDLEDGKQELVTYQWEVRDALVSSLYAYRDGALSPIPVPAPDGRDVGFVPQRLIAPGDGTLVIETRPHLYRRRDLFLFADGQLTWVRPPAWYVGSTLHIDRTVPITMEPGGGAVVADIKPNSDITVLIESAARPGFVMVRVSSGLVGWILLETLVGASDQVIWGAG